MRARVTIKIGKENWLGDILAYTGGYLRVSLHRNGSEEWPQWDAATPAKCVIHEGERRHASDATVLKQDRALVWLQVPPTWSCSDRRLAPRQLGGFRVRFEADGMPIEARCVDISPGGIKIRTESPLPERARVRLEFQLPSDRQPVRTDGVVLRSSCDSESAELGVRFANTPVVDSVRIATYCYL